MLLPSVLTLWLVVKAYQFVDNTIAEPINRGVRLALTESTKRGQIEWLRAEFEPTADAVARARSEFVAENGSTNLPRDEQLRDRLRAERVQTWWRDHWYMDLIGLLVAVVSVYIAGRLLGGFVGRRVYRRIERIITSVPIFKQVYPHVKQVVDFLFADEQPIKFNRVVLVEYPRRDMWSIGFLTGDSLRAVHEEAGESASVFIPSSPTPFTGYTLSVPVSDLIEIPISVEEAIRFTVSGGVLVPGHQSAAQIAESIMTAQAATSSPPEAPPERSDPESAA